MQNDFEQAELTRKTLRVWGDLLSKYESGAIGGGTFRTAFQAVYDAVSGLAEWVVIRAFLESYNQDLEGGLYQGSENVQVFQRDDGKVLCVLLLEGPKVKSLISATSTPLLSQTVEYSDELEARDEFEILTHAYLAKPNFMKV